MLVDRKRELDELNRLLAAPAAHLVAVSGRRRLGKTTRLRYWAKQSGQPFLYWVASHFPSPVLLVPYFKAHITNRITLPAPLDAMPYFRLRCRAMIFYQTTLKERSA